MEPINNLLISKVIECYSLLLMFLLVWIPFLHIPTVGRGLIITKCCCITYDVIASMFNVCNSEMFGLIFSHIILHSLLCSFSLTSMNNDCVHFVYICMSLWPDVPTQFHYAVICINSLCELLPNALQNNTALWIAATGTFLYLFNYLIHCLQLVYVSQLTFSMQYLNIWLHSFWLVSIAVVYQCS